MFNFSANQLCLVKQIDARACRVFLMQDRHTGRLYRLFDFSKARQIAPNQHYCVSGKVNSANGQLYLVIESLKSDAKHPWAQTLPDPADGAGGEPAM